MQQKTAPGIKGIEMDEFQFGVMTMRCLSINTFKRQHLMAKTNHILREKLKNMNET